MKRTGRYNENNIYRKFIEHFLQKKQSTEPRLDELPEAVELLCQRIETSRAVSVGKSMIFTPAANAPARAEALSLDHPAIENKRGTFKRILSLD